MGTPIPARTRRVGATVAGCLVLSLITACSSSSSSSTASSSSTSASSNSSVSSPSTEFGLKPDPAVEALIPASVRAAGVLNDAIYNDAPPLEFLQNNKLVGIEPDFAEALSEIMGIRFNNIQVGTFDTIIPGLLGKRYDIAVASFAVTAAREKIVDIIVTYAVATSFATEQGSSLIIDNASDLCGKTIATLAGSSFVTQLQGLSSQACTSAGKPGITLKQYANTADVILAVTSGRVQIYADITPNIAYAVQNQGAKLSLQPFLYQPVPQGLALPHNSPLDPAILAAFKDLYTDGTYAKILAKWGVSKAALPESQIQVNPPPPAS